MLPFTLNTIIAGNMEDDNLLAAVGIGGSTIAIFGASLLIGINGGQDTLTSQAFGDNKLEMCGVYINRGRMVCLAFSLTLSTVLFFFGEEIMLLMGQDETVSKIAALYIKT